MQKKMPLILKRRKAGLRVNNNTKWLRKRKLDKITKIISAIILAIVLVNLHDMVLVLGFFYAVAIVGVVTMIVELSRIIRK